MSFPRRTLSSGTLLGVTVTLLGAIMLGVAGPSVLAYWLGAGVLSMGLLATLTSILNRTGPTIPEVALPPFGSEPQGRGHSRNPDSNPQHARPTLDLEAPADEMKLPALLGEFCSRFRSWYERLEPSEPLWPAFDRWMRDTLNELLGARRVRCFRIEDSDRHLIPLTNQLDDPPIPPLSKGGSGVTPLNKGGNGGTPLSKGGSGGVSLAKGNPPVHGGVLGVVAHSLVEHVVATGRGYRRGDLGNGELVDRLAAEWSSSSGIVPPAWLLPIRQGNKTSGLILVGELDGTKLQDSDLLHAVGDLLELFWHVLDKTDALAIARRTDRASGVLNRIDLTSRAEKVLDESRTEGEPVVLLSLSVEGVRRLDDDGEWGLRDWLMQQVGEEMRQRLRSDDLVGRFSDDRFVAVLRRLDTSLGQLIARKVLEAVAQRINDQPVINAAVKVRCGLADVETEQDFESVLGRSFDALQQARSSQQDVMIAPSSRERKNANKTEGNHG